MLSGCVGATVGVALHAQLRSIEVMHTHIHDDCDNSNKIHIADTNSYTTQYKFANGLEPNQILERLTSWRGVAT